MSGHRESRKESRSLCDELYEALKGSIPNLRCAPTQRWCGYYTPTRRRFAYVAHFKTSDRIEVWCRGSLNDLRKVDSPVVRGRTRTDSGGWEDEFPGRFEVTHASQIPGAAKLLYTVSYRAS
jgi:hypothetical protein